MKEVKPNPLKGGGVDEDDDNASIRTTSTFATISSRLSKKRWGGLSKPSFMQSNQALPTYDESQDQTEGPSSTPARMRINEKEKGDYPDEEEDIDSVPDVLYINGRKVEPLVGLSQEEAHLSLLTAFRDIRTQCFSLAKTKEEQNQIWKIYLRRANYRLSTYIETVLPSALQISEQDLKAPPRSLLHLGPSGANNQAKRAIMDIPEDALPPLDVMMLWHAYMLNPGRYAEDIARVDGRRILHFIRFPFVAVANRIRNSPQQGPLLDDSDRMAARWTRMTGQSFHLSYKAPPLSSTETETGKPLPDEGVFVECPMCNRFDESRRPDEHPSNSASTSGFILSWQDAGRDDWKGKCSSCDAKLNPNVLRGGMLLNDIEQWLKSRPSQKIKPFHLRGGLVSARNGRLFEDDPHAPILCRMYPFERTVLPDHTGMWALLSHVKKDTFHDERLYGKLRNVPKNDLQPILHFVEAKGDIEKWSELIDRDCQARIVLAMEEKAIDMNRRISLVTKYYIEGDPLISNTSIDLADAVLRQFSFIDEMDQMGWLDTTSFKEGAEEMALPSLTSEERRPNLARSIVRYHRWLNVLTVKNDLLCPTLDIDLAWHTHQLLPSYYADCFVTIGMFVDHDDKLPAPTLSTAFDRTAKTWYDLYGQPYSACGCPAHNGSDFRQSLRKLRINLGSNSKDNDEKENIPAEGRQKGAGTHPSVHNITARANTNVKSSHAMAMKIRRKQEQNDIKAGKRPETHKDAFMYV